MRPERKGSAKVKTFHSPKFPLFHCTPKCTWSLICDTVRATCNSGMDISPPWDPRSRIFLLHPNFFFYLRSIYCDLPGSAMLHVTSPHTLVPSHNNSRGSNLLSALYMRSLSWYGLISLKSLSLQFLVKWLYMSHTQHSVSAFSSLPDCPTVAFLPSIDDSKYSAVELTKNTYLDITHKSGFGLRKCQRKNSAKHSGPLQQLIMMNCEELQSPSNCQSLLFFTLRGQLKFVSCNCWMRTFS